MTGLEPAAIEFGAMASALLAALALPARAWLLLSRDRAKARRYGPRIRLYRSPYARLTDLGDAGVDPDWPDVRAAMPGTAQEREGITRGA